MVKREGKTLGGRRRGSKVKREAGRRKLCSVLGTKYRERNLFL